MPSASTSESRQVTVGWDRIPGWIERYDARHPGTSWTHGPAEVRGVGPDGSSCAFAVPFAPLDDLTPAGLAAHLARPWTLGVVLVRKGGFAVARVAGPEVVESKVGQRHVQGRSKAGGWSQQRFARRRDQQAQAAYDAAAGHVERIVMPHAGRLDLLVTGGDRSAVDAVLATRALAPLAAVPQRWLPGLPDPKRQVLADAVTAARSATITVVDPPPQV